MTTLGAMAFWIASAILIACGSGVWGLMGKGCEGWAVVRLCVGIELGSTIGFPLVVSPQSARRFYQSRVLNDGNVTVAAIAVVVQPASWLSRGLAGRCNPVTIRFSDTPFQTASLPRSPIHGRHQGSRRRRCGLGFLLVRSDGRLDGGLDGGLRRLVGDVQSRSFMNQDRGLP